jgi:hypothetical protein
MAPACRSASVIASTRLQSILRLPLPVLFMVAPSFPWFRQSGGDDPNSPVALCVDDGKKVVLDHAELDIPTLAVILPPVLTYHSERIIEGQASCLEAYAVIGQILGGLDVIPLELIIFHILRGTRIMQGCRDAVGRKLAICVSTVCLPRARFLARLKTP